MSTIDFTKLSDDMTSLDNRDLLIALGDLHDGIVPRRVGISAGLYLQIFEILSNQEDPIDGFSHITLIDLDGEERLIGKLFYRQPVSKATFDAIEKLVVQHLLAASATGN
jgi:hypothetical protein